MTIGTAGARVSLNCDGATKVFPVPIQAYLAVDFIVILTAPASAGGAQTLLILNSDYSMAASGSLQPTQWTLTTLAVNAYPAGYSLQALVSPQQVQQTQYVQGQAFPSLAVQTNYDRLTQMIQRLQDQVSRSPHTPDGDVTPLMLLPPAAQRALTNLGFDINGNISVSQVLAAGTLSAATIGGFLYPQTAAEAAATFGPIGNGVFSPTLTALMPQRYGAVGDGVNDDTTALQHWLTVLGQSVQQAYGFLPAGTYKHTAALSVPQGVYIQGAGTLLSILKPAAGFVGVALTTANNVKLKSLAIDGTNAPAQTGLNIAPSNTDYNDFEDIWVQNFSANAGLGVLVQNSVRLSAKRLVSISNGTNMKLLSQTPGSLPTTCTFSACRFATATGTPGGTGIGVLINSGQSIVFDENCVFEGNIQQGVLAQSVVGGVIQDLKLEECWFEDNWHNHVDTGIKVYSFQLDGTAGTGANAHLADVRFTQGAVLSDRKGVLVNNALCTWESLRCFGFPNDFVVTGAGSYVQVVDDPADRNGRFISNANAANVQYPLYKPIIDLGTGLSVLPTIQKIVGLAYSASMTPDISAGDSFVVSITNTAAFTINAPINVSATLDPGKRINFKLRNVSGNNVPGAVTWNAVFKLAAWVQPQNNFSHSIDFIWDGANWCESTRTTTQVPT